MPYGEVKVQLHALLTKVMDGDEWASSTSRLFITHPPPTKKEPASPTGVGVVENRKRSFPAAGNRTMNPRLSNPHASH